jgi:hypothetical protein
VLLLYKNAKGPGGPLAEAQKYYFRRFFADDFLVVLRFEVALRFGAAFLVAFRAGRLVFFTAFFVVFLFFGAIFFENSWLRPFLNGMNKKETGDNLFALRSI